jgi:hypothetical protein
MLTIKIGSNLKSQQNLPQLMKIKKGTSGHNSNITYCYAIKEFVLRKNTYR